MLIGVLRNRKGKKLKSLNLSGAVLHAVTYRETVGLMANKRTSRHKYNKGIALIGGALQRSITEDGTDSAFQREVLDIGECERIGFGAVRHDAHFWVLELLHLEMSRGQVDSEANFAASRRVSPSLNCNR